MSKVLKKNIGKLQMLIHSNPKTQKLLLSELAKDDEFFLTLSEICKNVCCGFFKQKLKKNKGLKKHINKYKSKIVEIALKPKNKVKRKRLVNQTGKFLPVALSILVPVIADLLLRK